MEKFSSSEGRLHWRTLVIPGAVVATVLAIISVGAFITIGPNSPAGRLRWLHSNIPEGMSEKAALKRLTEHGIPMCSKTPGFFQVSVWSPTDPIFQFVNLRLWTQTFPAVAQINLREKRVTDIAVGPIEYPSRFHKGLWVWNWN